MEERGRGDVMDDRMQDRADDQLDGRIRNAYESVSLSEEAEGLMLEALLAYQAEREADDAHDGPAQAEVMAMPRRSWLRFAIPAAACLLVALVVGTQLMGGSQASVDAKGDAAAPAGAEMAYESSAEAAAATPSLELILEDGRPVELNPEQVGESLGHAELDGVPCEIFEIDPYPYGRDDLCAAQLDGDGAFYLVGMRRDG